MFLKIDQLNQYYSGSHILRSVSLEAKLGEVTVLLGRNGVGKTTLIKSLMGLVPIKSGEIELDGVSIKRMAPYQRAKAGIGFVPQGREIFGRLSVLENLQMGLATQAANAKVPEELFELFPILREMQHRRGGDLSGGQQQRLCIARALAVEPDVLLMDEPCSALDPIATAKIEELIEELKGKLTIVIVTHNMQQAARVSDKTAFFYMGELVEYDATKLMFTNPKDPRTQNYITGRFS